MRFVAVLLLALLLAPAGCSSAESEEASRPAPTAAERDPSVDVEVISHGEAVPLEQQLVPGKVTLVDYFADWCAPCHLLARDLQKILRGRRDVAWRRINIGSWSSAAAKDAKHRFGLSAIPHVRIYGPAGELLGEVVGRDAKKVAEYLPD